jgi:hypothetical protein
MSVQRALPRLALVLAATLAFVASSRSRPSRVIVLGHIKARTRLDNPSILDIAPPSWP